MVGIAPRLTTTKIKLIPVNINEYIFLVKIPPLGDTLYQVCFKSSGKYYNRLENRKYQLNEEEIRNTILGLLAFKNERQGFIKAD